MNERQYAWFILNTYGESVCEAFLRNIMESGMDDDSGFWYVVADELWVITFLRIEPPISDSWVSWEGDND